MTSSKKTKTSKKKNKIKRSKPTVSRVAPAAKKQTGSVGRSLLKGAGQALGSVIGLGDIGSSVGNFVSDIIGFGDYTVNKNVLMGGSDQVPSFSHMDDSITVTHREYVGDVISSTGFSSYTYDVNPSNPQLFPWLSLLTDSFEQYEFEGLVIAFNPTAGSAISSTNNALGTVVMATEYDVSRPLFISKMEMENYEYSTSCKPCDPMLHPLECNPKLDIVNSRYIGSRFRTNAAGSTARHEVEDNLSRLGRFQLATVGMQQSGINVGELWVTYKVKLMKPRVADTSSYQGMFHAVMDDAVLTSGSPATVYTGGWKVLPDSTSNLNNIKFSNTGALGPTGQLLVFNRMNPKTRLIIMHSIRDGTNILGYQSGGATGGTLVQPTPFVTNGGYEFHPKSALPSSQLTASATSVKLEVTCVQTNDNSYIQDGSFNLPQYNPTATGSGLIFHDLIIFVVPILNLTTEATLPSALGNGDLELQLNRMELERRAQSTVINRLVGLLGPILEAEDDEEKKFNDSDGEYIRTPLPSTTVQQQVRVSRLRQALDQLSF